MRQIGQALVFLGVLTGIDGVGIFIAYRNFMGIVAIILPVLLIFGGSILIKRSAPKP